MLFLRRNFQPAPYVNLEVHEHDSLEMLKFEIDGEFFFPPVMLLVSQFIGRNLCFDGGVEIEAFFYVLFCGTGHITGDPVLMNEIPY